MYIQRVPHPLAHFSRDPYSKAASDVLQTTSTNGTTSSAVSQFTSHRTGYVVLVVVLTTLLLCLVGFFIARRGVGSLLPCTRGDKRREFTSQMQREGHSQFTEGFSIIPSWNVRKDSGSSHTPTSPSSDGPSTPVNCEERGDLGVNRVLIAKEAGSFVPIPIIVHTPSQTHQTTFLTGPDTSDSSDFAAPTAHHEHFFDERLPLAAHGSVIRPHGLPLSPVPEESHAMDSFSSPYFEVDEETLYGLTPELHPPH